MSESVQPTPFRKLNYTPFCDLIRGRVTGRLDVKLAIEGSELPEPGKALVRRIVHGTRLWRSEKYVIAIELAAHFQDGIDAGESIEQLIERFGDERRAAKLIRRAKVRNRPLLWHFSNAILRATVCLILFTAIFYASASLYFFMGRPTPSVDYIAILNRKAEQFPPDQRAWPIYRDLHLTFYDHDSDAAASEFQKMIFARSSDEQWPRLTVWLGQHQNDLALIHSASEKPALGMIFAADGISGDLRLSPHAYADLLLNSPMIAASLAPYQYLVEQSAALLGGDAMLAAQRSDAPRVVSDIEAMLRIAQQVREVGTYGACYTSIEIRDLIVKRISDILVEDPAVLSDADLGRLAHLLTKPDSPAELISFDAARFTLADIVQRLFTDSGNGGGRLTPEGLQLLLAASHTVPPEVVKKKQLLPLYMIAGPSRAQTLEEGNRIFNLSEANLRLHPWEISQAKPDHGSLVQSKPLEWFGSLVFTVMYSSSSGSSPVNGPCEHYLGHRDGVLIGIALEVYRRAHNGSYPPTLEDLHPALLPSLPVDRITGGPLHYRLIDGKPLVYSVGDDRDDDGGKMPLAQDDDLLPPWNADLAARWVKQEYARNGDWILYPQPAATR